MKVLVRGRVYYRVPCEGCGAPRDPAAVSGRCRTCWRESQGPPKLIHVGGGVYKRRCPK